MKGERTYYFRRKIIDPFVQVEIWLLDSKASEASTSRKGTTLQKHACAQCFHSAG